MIAVSTNHILQIISRITHSDCKLYVGGKLASLEEFKVQREDLMNKMTELEQQLKENEDEHNNDIYSLERKQVVDKDR